MEWTFDPLEIKNAYLNIESWVTIARRYNVNQYGITSSPLQEVCPLTVGRSVDEVEARRAVLADPARGSLNVVRDRGAGSDLRVEGGGGDSQAVRSRYSRDRDRFTRRLPKD